MAVQNQFDPSEAAKARQRTALLTALKEGPVTTLEAREVLGVMHPAGRVLELRRAGHTIVTLRRRVVDVDGRSHATAEYHLGGGAK